MATNGRIWRIGSHKTTGTINKLNQPINQKLRVKVFKKGGHSF